MKVPTNNDLSFSEKEQAKKSVYILYFTVTDEQANSYYVFYGLNGAYLTEFNQMMESKAPDFKKLQEYGEILFFGRGEPTDEVKTIMRDQFNFNLDTISNPDAPATMVIIPPEKG